MIEQERVVDDCDRAANYAQAEITARIKHAQNQLGNGPIPTGRCHSCQAEIPKPKLFCVGDCADDYEAARKDAQRTGRRHF